MTAQQETVTYLVITAKRELVRIIEVVEYETRPISPIEAGRVAVKRNLLTADGRPVIRQDGQFLILHHGEREATREIDSAIQISWRPHPADCHWVAHGELRAICNGEIRIAREVDLTGNRELVVPYETKLQVEAQVRRHIRTALIAMVNACNLNVSSVSPESPTVDRPQS